MMTKVMATFARLAFGVGMLLVPSAAFAAQGLEKVLLDIGRLISLATPIVVAFALLAFFWGLAMYLLNFNSEDKEKKKGRDMMLYGIIALFVIVSVWGLVTILQQTFGLTGANNPDHINIPYLIRDRTTNP